MATMSIEDDIRDALDAGRITWAEAGELRDLRKSRAKAKKVVDKVQREIDTLNDTMDRFSELNEKMMNGAAPAEE